MRQSPDLAGVDRAIDVQHVLGRHPHGLGDDRALVGAVAGMAAAEVVGDAPADRVELDAAADAVAVRGRLGLLEGQHLRLQELQLQRHGQPVLGRRGRSRTKHSPATNISRATMACSP